MKYRVKRHAVVQPLDTSYRLIPLTQGQNAIVDATDFEHISQWNWFAYWDTHTKSFYAKRLIKINGIKAIVGLQNEIMGGKADHKNHDTLDNRRKNLRRCSGIQNSHNRRIKSNNTSGFKGVSREKRRGGWIALIRSGGKCGKRIYLGCFPTKEDAARAYDQAAKKYHGEFAFLNFSD